MLDFIIEEKIAKWNLTFPFQGTWMDYTLSFHFHQENYKQETKKEKDQLTFINRSENNTR